MALNAPELAGRVAVVSGGASGIGRTTCLALASNGVRVVCFDLIHPTETVLAIESAGGTVSGIAGDVSDRRDVTQAVETATREFGRLDIAANCAGVISNTSIDKLNDNEWDRTVRVNLTGSFVFTQAALEPMMSQGSGCLILVSSVAARMGGVRSGPAYAAAKGGILAMAKWTSRFAGPSGVTVNVIAPGTVRTPMTDGLGYRSDGIPLGRLGEPEDIAEAVVYLASDSARWMTGQTIDVNGGVYMN
ncbi:MAG: SDR family oxidoreductase [Comamonadaceae bacterium]|nr:MAG: SDR family oxidoreductase [Comamonadaceae bacterium]